MFKIRQLGDQLVIIGKISNCFRVLVFRNPISDLIKDKEGQEEGAIDVVSESVEVELTS